MANAEAAKRDLLEALEAPGEGWNEEVAILGAVKAVVDTRDVAAQRFVAEEVRRRGSTKKAGWMALALIGEAQPGPVNLKKKLGLYPANPEVLHELGSLIGTASDGVLTAAVRAVLMVDAARAAEIFRPFWGGPH